MQEARRRFPRRVKPCPTREGRPEDRRTQRVPPQESYQLRRVPLGESKWHFSSDLACCFVAQALQPAASALQPTPGPGAPSTACLGRSAETAA
jgi:hypothetical protein